MVDLCKVAVDAKLKDGDRAITDEEVKDIIDRLRSAKDYAKSNPEDGSVSNKVAQVSSDLKREAQRAKVKAEMNAYRNVVLRREGQAQVLDALSKIKGKKGLYLGIQSILTGINTPIKGAQRSAAGIGHALTSHWSGNLRARLRKDGVLTEFGQLKSGSPLEKEIADAIFHYNSDGVGKPKVSSTADKIALALVDLQETTRQRKNLAGADVVRKKGFISHQTHDAALMKRKGQQAWSDIARKTFDFEKMGIPAERIEGYLESAYLSLRTGVRLTDEKTPIAEMFKGSQNLAKSMSRSQEIIFKDGGSFLEYNRLFGSGSLRESILQGMTVDGKNVGIMERLGTNPKLMLDAIIEDVSAFQRKDATEAVEYLKEHKSSLDASLDVVSGEVNIGSNTTIAKVGEWARALKTMASLGRSVLAAQTDFAFNATNRIYHGKSLTQAWSDAVVSPFMTMGNKERRHTADLLGAGLDGFLGSVMTRFSADDYVPGGVHGMLTTFFKLNLLGPWTDGVKSGATMILSRDFAMMSGKSFDGLTPEYQRLFNLYGVDAKQWDVIRAAKAQADDGREYILPGDIDALSGQLFTGLSKFQQAELKRKSKENLATLYSSEADFSAPTPGAREQSMMKTFGGKAIPPNTPLGQALRFFWQFKAFGMTATTKVGGRAMYGGGSNMQIANLIASSTLLGIAVAQLKEITSGREPLEASPELLLRGMLQGGAAGIYADFLLGQDYSRYGRSMIETAAGPVLGDMSTAIEFLGGLVWSTAKGDPDAQMRNLVNLVKGYVPGQNMFLVKEVLDYAVWYQLQELMNPGYLTRMERNLKNRSGQGMWISPSDYVPTGGIFK